MKSNNKFNGKLSKVLGLIIAVVMILTSFTACTIKEKNENVGNESSMLNTVSDSKDGTTSEKTSDNNESGKQNVIYPLIVKDVKGTEMTIKKPSKIVSLTLTSDEMLLSLVEENRIAAVSHISVDPGLSNVAEEAEKIPVKAKLELESLITLQPDLIIVSDFTDQNAIKQLRDAKIVVYVMAIPNNIEQVKNAVSELANLVGEEQNGQDIIAWMDSKLKAIDDKIKTLKEEQKVKAMSYDSFQCTHGKGTTFDDIAKHAGVTNMASEAGMEMWPEISKEKIIDMNPEALFLPSWSYEGFDAEKYTEDFKNDKSLAGVKAIKNNKVFNLPEAHMITTSQYIVLGVEDMAKVVYPELFK